MYVPSPPLVLVVVLVIGPTIGPSEAARSRGCCDEILLPSWQFGETALMIAACEGSAECVSILVAHGADLARINKVSA